LWRFAPKRRFATRVWSRSSPKPTSPDASRRSRARLHYRACAFRIIAALAKDRVYYVGHPIAVVVARDRYIAADALDLITVEYEPASAVTDPEKALEAGTPAVHPEWPDNICFTYHQEGGDPETAFRQAEVVVKQRIVNQRLVPSPMETRGVVADWHVGNRTVLHNKSLRSRINELPTKCATMLRRGATYVTSAILPIRNVDLTSLLIAHIVLILKAELFLRTTAIPWSYASWPSPRLPIGLSLQPLPPNIDQCKSYRSTPRIARYKNQSVIGPFAMFVTNAARDKLRRLTRNRLRQKVTPYPVGEKDYEITRMHRCDRSTQGR
jgi:hypothetical protein